MWNMRRIRNQYSLLSVLVWEIWEMILRTPSPTWEAKKIGLGFIIDMCLYDTVGTTWEDLLLIQYMFIWQPELPPGQAISQGCCPSPPAPSGDQIPETNAASLPCWTENQRGCYWRSYWPGWRWRSEWSEVALSESLSCCKELSIGFASLQWNIPTQCCSFQDKGVG